MFEIHSKSDCPWCERAKDYFDQHDLPYTEYRHDDIADRQQLYDELSLTNQNRTVPQIFFVNGMREYIGGYQDLIQARITDRLQMENFNAEF